MTAALLAIGAGFVGLIVGLRVNARRLATVREVLRLRDERHDAWNLNAQCTDLAEVGPVTGPTNVVELFDGARLAEWRGQAEPVVHEPEPDGLFGRVCAYSVHCNEPVAGRVTWDTGKVEWLCTEHYTLVMGTEPCPEAGGCRRPEQCQTGCHWRRLDALNHGISD